MKTDEELRNIYRYSAEQIEAFKHGREDGLHHASMVIAALVDRLGGEVVLAPNEPRSDWILIHDFNDPINRKFSTREKR